MAKNKLSDVNDHIIAQMERLCDEELTEDKLGQEIQRSKALAGLAQQSISASRLVLDATKLMGRGDVEKENIQKLID